MGGGRSRLYDFHMGNDFGSMIRGRIDQKFAIDQADPLAHADYAKTVGLKFARVKALAVVNDDHTESRLTGIKYRGIQQGMSTTIRSTVQFPALRGRLFWRCRDAWFALRGYVHFNPGSVWMIWSDLEIPAGYPYPLAHADNSQAICS